MFTLCKDYYSQIIFYIAFIKRYEYNFTAKATNIWCHGPYAVRHLVQLLAANYLYTKCNFQEQHLRMESGCWNERAFLSESKRM